MQNIFNENIIKEKFVVDNSSDYTENEFNMSKIVALDVWEQVCSSEWCVEAYNFYREHPSILSILERGSADFDKKVTSNEKEKSWYRAAYYAGRDQKSHSRYSEGYMDMHIKQNLKAFNHLLLHEDFRDKSCLFVDFGCGPMTSGVAFAEFLSSKYPKYRDKVTYLGIDASDEMGTIATWVNEVIDDKIFNDHRIKHSNEFKNSQIEDDIQPEIAVLCLSFVLAPKTNKVEWDQQVGWIKSLAKRWHSSIRGIAGCMESRIIYLNPNNKNFHVNWDHVVKYFSNTEFKDWEYCVMDPELLGDPSLRNNFFAQIILGEKRAKS